LRARHEQRGLVGGIDFHHAAAVLACGEEIAILVGHHAVRVVSARLPHLGPLGAGGDYARNCRHRDVLRTLRLGRTTPTAGWPAAATTSRRSWLGRRQARRKGGRSRRALSGGGPRRPKRPRAGG